MPRALAEEIANDLWTRSDGQGEVMLSGQNTAYLMERGLGMLKRIQFIGNNYQIIHDPSEVPEEITKVSVYLHEGVESYTERFVPRWKEYRTIPPSGGCAAGVLEAELNFARMCAKFKMIRYKEIF